MKKGIATIILSFIMLLIISRAQASFMNAQQLMLNKNWHEAAQVLVKMSDDNLSEVDQGLKYFALGVASSHLQKWQSAELYFNLSRQKSPRLVSHSYFELAKILINKDEYEKAKEYLEKVSKSPSSRNLQNETYLMLSEIDMKNKKWNSAYKNLSILERRWRGEEDHPLVIWRLIQVELERNRKWKACRWARKLYSKYPSHPIIYDWSIDLPRNKINDKSLGCLASENDIQNRIQRWHWAGESDRATKELQELKERIDEGAKYEIDELMSRHLIQQGFAGEAVERLLPYYEQKHKNYDYLMSLAKAASRGGEYQTAVGAYYKAHKLKTKGRDGRTALFRAAFLSYQFQDYDGATRKFQEFIKLYTKSGLSRDAQWHLAWIRYLKGDYRGALSSLSNILQQKKIHKRKWSKFPEEKIRYWLAMSHLRLGEFDVAREIFNELIKDKLMNFYSQAAHARMSDIPVEKKLTQAPLVLAGIDPSRLPASVFEEKDQSTKLSKEEEESEENLSEMEEEVVVGEEDYDVPPEKEETPVTFKDPKLKENFERAQDFVRIGLYDRARWEFYEVERRTRNKDYLMLLMKAYEDIGSFHRSAYIGQVFFVTPRERYEMNSVKYLWKHTYPLAFQDIVNKYSDSFAVPKPFIWSIMRAESRYRPFVVSPVGAQGLMQIMPNTGRQVARLIGDFSFQVNKLKEPETNIRLGSRYLMRLLKKFEGSVPLSAASYNAGPHRVESWLASFGTLDMDEFIEHIPFVETRNYVKKVTRFFGVYKKLYEGNDQPISWLNKPVPVRLDRKPALRESWEQF